MRVDLHMHTGYSEDAVGAVALVKRLMKLE